MDFAQGIRHMWGLTPKHHTEIYHTGQRALTPSTTMWTMFRKVVHRGGQTVISDATPATVRGQGKHHHRRKAVAGCC